MWGALGPPMPRTKRPSKSVEAAADVASVPAPVPAAIRSAFETAGIEWPDVSEERPDATTQTLYERVLAVARRGDEASVKKAQTVFETLHDQWPSNIYPVIGLGVCAYSQGDARGALAIYDQVAEWPDARRCLDLHTNRGLALGRLGRHLEALDCFRHAIKYKPGEASILVMTANALSRLGNCSRADGYYRRALVIRPQDPDIHFNRATNALRRARLMEAEDSFRLALAFNATDADARLCLGLLLVRRRLQSTGMAHLNRAIQEKPEDTQNRQIFEAIRRVAGIERPTVAERMLKMYFPQTPEGTARMAAACRAARSGRSRGGASRRRV